MSFIEDHVVQWLSLFLTAEPIPMDTSMALNDPFPFGKWLSIHILLPYFRVAIANEKRLGQTSRRLCLYAVVTLAFNITALNTISSNLDGVENLATL